MRSLYGELHILSKIVLEIEMSIPSKVFTKREIHIMRITCKIPHLHMVEGTVHIGIKRPRLRQVVEIHLG